MPETDDCIFCGIAKGEIPSSIVAEDDATVAFLDIRPVNPGHTLVIPKDHAAYLADLPPKAGARLFDVARKVGAALRASGLRCEGVNLFLADGKAAGQEVFHVHLHVVPRYTGDGFGLKMPPDYGKSPPREKLEATAGKIRDALRDSA